MPGNRIVIAGMLAAAADEKAMKEHEEMGKKGVIPQMMKKHDEMGKKDVYPEGRPESKK